MSTSSIGLVLSIAALSTIVTALNRNLILYTKTYTQGVYSIIVELTEIIDILKNYNNNNIDIKDRLNNIGLIDNNF